MQNEVRTSLAKYRGSHFAVGMFQLTFTLSLFVTLWLAMWWTLAIGYWLTLLVALPTAGLAVRLFILQHDCGHGSLFTSKTANRIVGIVLSGVTMTPYECWRRQHARHHATNGQLDHRGIGDIGTITVAEYWALSRWGRLKYRLYRNPLLLFGVGPIFHFAVLQRFTFGLPSSWKRERRSVYATDLLLLCFFILFAWLVGPWVFLSIQLPLMAVASSIGAWLFYVQHQFEPTYWAHDDRWDFAAAATHGSSFLDLPWPLSWITANIGFHHIHHLDSRIPNYSLRTCHNAHTELQGVKRLTLWSSLRSVKLKLWDEHAHRMVTFRQAKRLDPNPSQHD